MIKYTSNRNAKFDSAHVRSNYAKGKSLCLGLWMLSKTPLNRSETLKFQHWPPTEHSPGDYGKKH